MEIGPKLIIVAVVAVAIVSVVFPGIHTVPAGYRGVVLEFGKPVGVAPEGLYTWFPSWTKSVVDMPVQTLKFEDPHADAASKDLQSVQAKIAVNYHLDPANVDEIYRTLNIAWEDRVIRPALQEVVKATTAKYTAEELITKRPLVQTDIRVDLTERIKIYGVIIEAINIVDFQFAKSFNDAIENKVVAEQNILKERNNLEISRVLAQQKVAEAEGFARSEITRANGSAVSRVLQAQAEARSLQLLNEQLRQSTSVLQLRAIEKWDGKLPVILVTSDGKQIPFIIDIKELLGNSTSVKRP